jgi:hypothetical protein
MQSNRPGGKNLAGLVVFAVVSFSFFHSLKELATHRMSARQATAHSVFYLPHPTV